MAKRIIALLVAIVLVAGGLVVFFYAAREKSPVPKTLSFKEMGIDIDATKYAAVMDVFEDRLLITFVSLNYVDREDSFMYVYNFTTKKSTNLTKVIDGAADVGVLDWNTIVWAEEKQEKKIRNASLCNLPERSLCGYDLKTGKKFEIYSGEGNRLLELGSYRTFGEWVAWSTVESEDGVLLYNPKSYLRNLKTGETYSIPEGQYLGIYEDTLIYAPYNESFIYGHNITTGEDFKIIKGSVVNNRLKSFSGDKFLYADNNTVFCYNLTTGEKDTVMKGFPEAPDVPDAVALDGDNVFYFHHESKNETLYDTISVYNLKTKKWKDLYEKHGEKPEGLDEFYFVCVWDVYDGRLVWIGNGYKYDPDADAPFSFYWTDLYYLEL